MFIHWGVYAAMTGLPCLTAGMKTAHGNNAKPNAWGYKAASWHKENARQMKEEVYEQVISLLSRYGKIEYVFWDGGWLGQSIDPELILDGDVY